MHLIAHQLAGQARFIMYRLEPLLDKPGTNKIPTNPADGRNSNAQDRATWLSYEDAATAADAWNLSVSAPVISYGVGVMIYPEGGLFCIDLDKCRDEHGGWQPHAVSFCGQFPGALTETSVSGNGLHIFGTTSPDLPAHGNKNKTYRMEAYTAERFIALGTEPRGDCRTDHTKKFTEFLHRYFPPPEDSSADWTDRPVAAWSGPSDDEALLAVARRSRSARAAFAGAATFADLHDAGDTSSYNGDESSADLAYFNMLAFWTGNDCERMERIASKSALRRDKWDREDYRHNTILKACASQKEWYSGRGDAAAPIPLQPTGTSEASREAAIPAVEFQIPPPPVPDAAAGTAPPLGAEPADTSRGQMISASAQPDFFKGYVYVEDMHEVLAPQGYTLDQKRFNMRFGGRSFMISDTGQPAKTAWEVFADSELVELPRVRGTLFDPRLPPLTIIEREGERWANAWAPVDIVMTPGDVSPFLNHVSKLYPKDWRVLLNYLKFMMQRKGEKCKWWPFLQGVPGNGKSYISDTMEYCLGLKFTQRPTPKNIDSQFNKSLYASLFLALEDVKVTDDYHSLWETLKPMVTALRIEIQPKGVDKVTREVCFNAIMNSNHKNGIRKERDDRRIGSFFAAQQSPFDLQRDGLTKQYFEHLWGWSVSGGWEHVAHYLNTDPIDADFRTDYAPVTSSTEEHILVSLGNIEQAVLKAIKINREGFRGGWICSTAVDYVITQQRKNLSETARRDLVMSLGYIPHPSLEQGFCTVAMPDASMPYLYVRNGHDWAVEHLTPEQVRDGYLAAQKV